MYNYVKKLKALYSVMGSKLYLQFTKKRSVNFNRPCPVY